MNVSSLPVKRERRHIRGLILILIAASTLTGTIASLILYSTALKQKSDFLLTEVQNLSRLIEAVARFDRHTFTDVSKATAATLSQVEAAFKGQKGFGQTGEILMGRREGDKIAIFLRYRDQRINQNLVLPLEVSRTEAMHLALSGGTGVGQFIDFRGEHVLSAYTYVKYLDTGLEIKIAMAEIVRPYLVSGVVIALASGMVIFLCVILFIHISKPVLEELEKHRILTEAVVESAQDIILSVDKFSLLRLINPAANKILGFNTDQLEGRDFSIIFYLEDKNTEQIINQIRERIFDNQLGGVIFLKKKDGTVFPASITSGQKNMADDPVTTIILHDLTELKKNEDTIRLLTHKMIEIKDAEQDNISKELHDTIGTNLVWLKLQTQQLTKDLPAKKDETMALLKSFDETIDMTRHLSHTLSPIAIEKLSLGVILRGLVERADSVSPVHVQFKEENLDFDLPAKMRFHIFRIVQEALGNALKHSQAKNIFVECGRKNNKLFISVTDDGAGFDAARRSMGLGLSLINERTNLLKGTLKIESKPGQGTEVHIEFPIA